MELQASEANTEKSMIVAGDTQKGLYFIQKTCPQTSAYNLVFSAKITADFDFENDVAKLEQSIQAVQQRHSILRQVYSESDGDILLKYTDEKLVVNKHDLQELSDTEQYEVIHHHSQKPWS